MSFDDDNGGFPSLLDDYRCCRRLTKMSDCISLRFPRRIRCLACGIHYDRMLKANDCSVGRLKMKPCEEPWDEKLKKHRLEGKRKFHEQVHEYMVQRFDLQSLENEAKRQKIEMNLKDPKEATPTKTSLLQKAHAVASMLSPKGLQEAMHQIISTIVRAGGDKRVNATPLQAKILFPSPVAVLSLPQQQTTSIDSPEESDKVTQQTIISPEDRTSMSTREEVAPAESEPVQNHKRKYMRAYKNIAVNKGKDVIENIPNNYDLEISHELAAIRAKAKAYDRIVKVAAGNKECGWNELGKRHLTGRSLTHQDETNARFFVEYAQYRS
jgi:hypothetical protein